MLTMFYALAEPLKWAIHWKTIGCIASSGNSCILRAFLTSGGLLEFGKCDRTAADERLSFRRTDARRGVETTASQRRAAPSDAEGTTAPAHSSIGQTTRDLPRRSVRSALAVDIRRGDESRGPRQRIAPRARRQSEKAALHPHRAFVRLCVHRRRDRGAAAVADRGDVLLRGTFVSAHRRTIRHRPRCERRHPARARNGFAAPCATDRHAERSHD